MPGLQAFRAQPFSRIRARDRRIVVQRPFRQFGVVSQQRSEVRPHRSSHRVPASVLGRLDRVALQVEPCAPAGEPHRVLRLIQQLVPVARLPQSLQLNADFGSGSFQDARSPGARRPRIVRPIGPRATTGRVPDCKSWSDAERRPLPPIAEPLPEDRPAARRYWRPGRLRRGSGCPHESTCGV